MLDKQQYNKDLRFVMQLSPTQGTNTQTVDFDSSPKDVDYSQMTQAEREAEFRRKRQQYIAQKMNRKKDLMKQKRKDFGDSSSDDSDDDGIGSRSSKSSARKTDNIEHQNPKVEIDILPQKQAPQIKIEQQSPQKKYSQSLDKFSVNVAGKKAGEWVKDVLVIGDKTIIIQNLTQQYRNLNKVKLLCETVGTSPFKIKINTESNKQVIFAMATNQEKLGLPISYYVFAKLIQQRLISTGVKLKVSQKPTGIAESLTANSIFYGRISKKSQVLGNWEQRLVIVNSTGIYSYKKQTQKHSMFIPKSTINQMWTRLEILENLLVLKIWYSGKKTQFGFPLTDCLTTNCWLYAFYAMMGKSK